MPEFSFTLWMPQGNITVEAESEADAEEKVDEFGWQDAEDEGIKFSPHCDGQEWEIR